MGVAQLKSKTPSTPQGSVVVETIRRGRPVAQTIAVANDARAHADDDLAELRCLERLLPWRSVDGAPLGMSVVAAGSLSADTGSRPAGSAYAVVSADSFDAAAELRGALSAVAGLSDDEWRTGWFETAGRRFAIRIYPTV